MKKHGIDENHFDSRKVINKEYILSLLNKEQDKSFEKPIIQTKPIEQPKIELKPIPQLVQRKEEPKAQVVKFNLNENKNYLPLSYLENTVCVDGLLKFINDINNKHKLNIKFEDFVAKVYLN